MAWRGRATALKVTSIDQFKSYLAGLSLAGWRPAGMTLHNTATPNRARWDAQPGEVWLRNLKSYYQGLGWSAGPHAFRARQIDDESRGIDVDDVPPSGHLPDVRPGRGGQLVRRAARQAAWPSAHRGEQPAVRVGAGGR